MTSIYPLREEDFARYLMEQIVRWGRPLSLVDVAAARALIDGASPIILLPLKDDLAAGNGALELIDVVEELGLIATLPMGRRRPARRGPSRR